MELGYIKIDDIIDLIRLIDKVITETDHYVKVDYGPSLMEVYIMKNGFHYKKDFDFVRRFVMYDPRAPERDAEKFRETKDYLKGLLEERNETL